MDISMLPTAMQSWIDEQLQGLPRQQREDITEAFSEALDWTWSNGFEAGQGDGSLWRHPRSAVRN